MRLHKKKSRKRLTSSNGFFNKLLILYFRHELTYEEMRQ